MDEMRTSLGAMRKKLRVKQVEVSKLAKIERTRLSMAENGWLKLRPEEIERVKKVLALFE